MGGPPGSSQVPAARAVVHYFVGWSRGAGVYCAAGVRWCLHVSVSLARSGLILYGTVGCHLCEEANDLLNGLAPVFAELHWRQVDIADDDELFEKYGWLIPVLRDDRGSELRWPF
ncbi:MAG: glutaredoxin family protein, partial [Pseudomonadota bacterium]